MSMNLFEDRIGAKIDTTHMTPHERLHQLYEERGIIPVTTKMMDDFGIKDITPYKTMTSSSQIKEALVEVLMESYKTTGSISQLIEKDSTAALKQISSMVIYLESLSGRHYIMSSDSLARHILAETQRKRQEAGAAGKDKGPSVEAMMLEGIPELTSQELYYLKIPANRISVETTRAEYTRAMQNLMLIDLPAMGDMPKAMAEAEKEWRGSVQELAKKEKEDIVVKLLAGIRNKKIQAHGKLSKTDLGWLGGTRSVTHPGESTKQQLEREIKMMAHGVVDNLSKYSEIPQIMTMDIGEAQREIKKISEKLIPLKRELKKDSVYLKKEIMAFEAIQKPDFTVLNENAKSIADIGRTLGTDGVSRSVLMDLLQSGDISAPDRLLKKYQETLKNSQKIVDMAEAAGKDKTLHVVETGSSSIRLWEDIQPYRDMAKGLTKKITVLNKLKGSPDIKTLDTLNKQYYKAHEEMSKDIMAQNMDFPELQKFMTDVKNYFLYIEDMIKIPGLRSKAKMLWDGGTSSMYKTEDRSDIKIPQEVSLYIGDVTKLTEEMSAQIKRISDHKKEKEPVPDSKDYESLTSLEHVADFILESPIVEWLDKKFFDMSTGSRMGMKGPSYEETTKALVQLGDKVRSFLNKVDVAKTVTDVKNSITKSGDLGTLIGKLYVRSDRSEVYDKLSDLMEQLDQPSSVISFKQVAQELKRVEPIVKSLGRDLDSDSMMSTITLSYERRKAREAQLEPVMKDIKAKGLQEEAALAVARKAINSVFGITDPDKTEKVAKRYLKQYGIKFTDKKAEGKSKRAMLGSVSEKIREIISAVKPKDIGWGYYKQRYKSVGKQPQKVSLRSFFDSNEQLNEFVHEINKRMDDFRVAVMTGEKPPREDSFNIDEMVSKVLMISEKNLNDTLLSNKVISQESDKNLEQAQKIVADSRKRASQARQDLEGVRQKYIPKLMSLVSFMKDPRAYVERSIDDLEEKEDLLKTHKEIFSLSEKERQRIKKHQRELVDARKFLQGRYITKKELLNVMSKYVHPKAYTDEEYLGQIAKMEKSSPDQVKEIFRKSIDRDQIENLNLERIEAIGAEIEKIYRSDPVRFDYDPKAYTRMIDDLQRAIDVQIGVLKIDGVDINQIEEKSREEAKNLPEGEVREISSILNFSDEKVKYGIAALESMRRQLADITVKHEAVKQEVPQKEQDIRDEYEAFLKQYELDIDEEAIRKLIVEATAITSKFNLSPKEKEKLIIIIQKTTPVLALIERYLTGTRESGSIKALQSRIEIIKFMDPAERRKMEYHLQDLIKSLQPLRMALSRVYNLAVNKAPRAEEDKTQMVSPQIAPSKAPSSATPPTTAPEPPVAPGASLGVKTAAYKVQDMGGRGDYDPIQDIESPDDEQPDTEVEVEDTFESPEMAEGVEYDVRDWKLAEAIFEKSKEELSRFIGRTDKVQDSKEKNFVSDQVQKLREQMTRFGKYMHMEIDVAGERIKAKEVPQRFQDLYDAYRERMFQATRHLEDSLDSIQKMHNKIRIQTEYKVRGLSDVEKKGIVDLFHQSLYWYLTQLWSTKVGQQFQFGDKTDLPFGKVYTTFANFADVKSNPIYQTILKNAEQIINYGLGDRKSDNSRASLLKQKKRLIQLAKDMGYTQSKDKKKSTEEAMEWLSVNVKAYKDIEANLAYFDRLKTEKERIYTMMKADIDKDAQKEILKNIAKGAKDDPKLGALIAKKIADLDKEAKQNMVAEAEKSETLPQGLTQNILHDADKVILDAEAIKKLPTVGKEHEEAPVAPKQAYDTNHPDFDLKWMYHPLMKQKISEGMIHK